MKTITCDGCGAGMQTEGWAKVVAEVPVKVNVVPHNVSLHVNVTEAFDICETCICKAFAAKAWKLTTPAPPLKPLTPQPEGGSPPPFKWIAREPGAEMTNAGAAALRAVSGDASLQKAARSIWRAMYDAAG
jgi:hypothetical protein